MQAKDSNTGGSANRFAAAANPQAQPQQQPQQTQQPNTQLQDKIRQAMRPGQQTGLPTQPVNNTPTFSPVSFTPTIPGGFGLNPLSPDAVKYAADNATRTWSFGPNAPFDGLSNDILTNYDVITGYKAGATTEEYFDFRAGRYNELLDYINSGKTDYDTTQGAIKRLESELAMLNLHLGGEYGQAGRFTDSEKQWLASLVASYENLQGELENVLSIDQAARHREMQAEADDLKKQAEELKRAYESTWDLSDENAANRLALYEQYGGSRNGVWSAYQEAKKAAKEAQENADNFGYYMPEGVQEIVTRLTENTYTTRDSVLSLADELKQKDQTELERLQWYYEYGQRRGRGADDLVVDNMTMQELFDTIHDLSTRSDYSYRQEAKKQLAAQHDEDQAFMDLWNTYIGEDPQFYNNADKLASFKKALGEHLKAAGGGLIGYGGVVIGKLEQALGESAVLDEVRAGGETFAERRANYREQYGYNKRAQDRIAEIDEQLKGLDPDSKEAFDLQWERGKLESGMALRGDLTPDDLPAEQDKLKTYKSEYDEAVKKYGEDSSFAQYKRKQYEKQRELVDALKEDKHNEDLEIIPDKNSETAKSYYETADKWLAYSSEHGQLSQAELEKMKADMGWFGKFLIDAGYTSAQMGFDIVTAYLSGGTSLTPMFLRVLGEEAGAAYGRGGDYDQIIKYATSKAGIEWLTERMFTAVPMCRQGKGLISQSAVEEVIGQLAKNDAGRIALRILFSAGEEGTEEIMAELLGPFAEKVFSEDYKGYGETVNLAQGMYEFLIGAVMGMVGSAGSAVTHPGYHIAMNRQIDVNNAARFQNELMNGTLEHIGPYSDMVRSQGTSAMDFIMNEATPEEMAQIRAESPETTAPKVNADQDDSKAPKPITAPEGSVAQQLIDLGDVNNKQFEQLRRQLFRDPAQLEMFEKAVGQKVTGETTAEKRLSLMRILNDVYGQNTDAKNQATVNEAAEAAKEGNPDTAAVTVLDRSDNPNMPATTIVETNNEGEETGTYTRDTNIQRKVRDLKDLYTDKNPPIEEKLTPDEFTRAVDLGLLSPNDTQFRMTPEEEAALREQQRLQNEHQQEEANPEQAEKKRKAKEKMKEGYVRRSNKEGYGNRTEQDYNKELDRESRDQNVPPEAEDNSEPEGADVVLQEGDREKLRAEREADEQSLLNQEAPPEREEGQPENGEEELTKLDQEKEEEDYQRQIDSLVENEEETAPPASEEQSSENTPAEETKVVKPAENAENEQTNETAPQENEKAPVKPRTEWSDNAKNVWDEVHKEGFGIEELGDLFYKDKQAFADAYKEITGQSMNSLTMVEAMKAFMDITQSEETSPEVKPAEEGKPVEEAKPEQKTTQEKIKAAVEGAIREYNTPYDGSDLSPADIEGDGSESDFMENSEGAYIFRALQELYQNGEITAEEFKSAVKDNVQRSYYNTVEPYLNSLPEVKPAEEGKPGSTVQDQRGTIEQKGGENNDTNEGRPLVPDERGSEANARGVGATSEGPEVQGNDGSRIEQRRISPEDSDEEVDRKLREEILRNGGEEIAESDWTEALKKFQKKLEVGLTVFWKKTSLGPSGFNVNEFTHPFLGLYSSIVPSDVNSSLGKCTLHEYGHRRINRVNLYGQNFNTTEAVNDLKLAEVAPAEWIDNTRFAMAKGWAKDYLFEAGKISKSQLYDLVYHDGGAKGAESWLRSNLSTEDFIDFMRAIDEEMYVELISGEYGWFAESNEGDITYFQAARDYARQYGVNERVFKDGFFDGIDGLIDQVDNEVRAYLKGKGIDVAERATEEAAPPEPVSQPTPQEESAQENTDTAIRQELENLKSELTKLNALLQQMQQGQQAQTEQQVEEREDGLTRPDVPGKRVEHKQEGLRSMAQNKGQAKEAKSRSKEIAEKFNVDDGTYISLTRAKVSEIADWCLKNFGLDPEVERLLGLETWGRLDFSEAGKAVLMMQTNLNNRMVENRMLTPQEKRRQAGESDSDYKARLRKLTEERYKEARESIDALLQMYADRKSILGQELQEQYKFSIADEIRMRMNQILLNYSADGYVYDSKNSLNVKMYRAMNDMLHDMERAVKNNDVDAIIETTKKVARVRNQSKLLGRLGTNMEAKWLKDFQKAGMDQEQIENLAYNNINHILDDFTPLSWSDAIETIRMNNLLSGLATGVNNLTNNAKMLRTGAAAQWLSYGPAKLFEKVTGKKVWIGDSSLFRTPDVVRAESIALKYAILSSYYGIGSENGRFDSRERVTFSVNRGFLERALARYQFFVQAFVLDPDAAAKARTEYGLRQGLENRFGDLNPETMTDEQYKAEAANKMELEGYIQSEKQRRTFQENSQISNAVNSLRNRLDKAANTSKVIDPETVIAGRQIGQLSLGKFMIAFAKVPTNVIGEKIMATPYGALFQLGNYVITLNKAARMHKAGEDMSAKDMAKASRDLGRACTTVGMIAVGALAAATGAIRDFDNDDEETRKLNAEHGWSGLMLNLDQLFHPLATRDNEWKDDDHIISLKYLEVLAMPLTIGSIMWDAHQADMDWGEAMWYATNRSFTDTFDALSELPGMQQVANLYNAYVYASRRNEEDATGNVLKAIGQFAAETSTGYITPNFVYQMMLGLDNTKRDVYNTDTYAERIKNIYMNKLPYFHNKLPEKTDSWGNVLRYGGNVGEALLNTMLLPGDVSTFSRSDVEKSIEAFNKAGYSGLAPESAPYKIEVGDETYELTAKQRREWKAEYGAAWDNIYSMALADKEFQALSMGEQYKVLKAMKLDLTRTTKNNFLPEGVTVNMDNWEEADMGDREKLHYQMALITGKELWDDDIHGIADNRYADMDKYLKTVYPNLTETQTSLLNNTLSHLDDLYDASQVGINSEMWQKAYNIYYEYSQNPKDNKTNPDGGWKATDATRMWTEIERAIGANDKQMDWIEQNMKLYNHIAADSEKYHTLVDSGWERDTAHKLITGMSELIPAEGLTNVSYKQRLTYIAKADYLSPEQKWEAFYEYCPDNYTKVISTMAGYRALGYSYRDALSQAGKWLE